jgi:hypothetical protein
MTQAVIAGQSPDVLPQLEQLQARAAELRVKSGDLEVQRDQIARQRAEAKSPADLARFDAQYARVQHDFNVAQSDLMNVSAKMAELQHVRDMEQAREAQQVLTIQPPPAPQDPFDKAQLRGMEAAGFVLLIPLVIALARRIWRGGKRAPAFDFESSPRLQRMEQAIESIAIEVERIGEAQRFTTKLLSERQVEPVAGHMPPIQTARREPGTITPH